MTEPLEKKLDYPTRKHKNEVRFDIKSGIEHKTAILKECVHLIENSIPFYTRARSLKTNLVADLIAFYPFPIVYEFQNTEKDISIERKKREWESEGFSFIVKKLSQE